MTKLEYKNNIKYLEQELELQISQFQKEKSRDLLACEEEKPAKQGIKCYDIRHLQMLSDFMFTDIRTVMLTVINYSLIIHL